MPSRRAPRPDVEKTSHLPDVKLSLRTEFNEYAGAVRPNALFQLRDIVDQEGGDLNIVANLNDLDLEQIDLDADAMREIGTIVDRSTTAADLAAAGRRAHKRLTSTLSTWPPPMSAH